MSAREMVEAGNGLPPLPAGWTWIPLGSIADVKLGKMLSPKAFGPGLQQLPYLRNENVRWFAIDTGDVKLMGFTSEEVAKFRLMVGDLLVCEGGEPGRCAVVTRSASHLMFQKALHRVRPNPQALDSRFLQFCIRHFIDSGTVIERRSETTIQHLPREKMVRMPVPVPPISEQRRIVAKIEELFSDLDAGVAALERVKANLKRYRASVLKAAVEGRLATNGHTAAPASHRDWKPMGTVIESLEQGWSPRCERTPSIDPTEWAVMTTTAIQQMRFNGCENKRLPGNLAPVPELEVQVGDLLITRAGPRSRAGVTCMVRSARPRLIVCDKAYRFRCVPEMIRAAYAEVVLNSPPILKSLDGMKTGISDSGVNLTQGRFRELLIPLPPLWQQDHIVSEVQRRLSVADAVQAVIERGLIRAARLRQSILKHAFEGKLVPQDPADEPASAMLERIGSPHEAAGRPTPARSRRRAKAAISSTR